MTALSLNHWSKHASRMGRLAGQWWLKEFSSLFPMEVVDRLLGRNHILLAIEPTSDPVSLELLGSRQRSIAKTSLSKSDYQPELVDEFLRANGFEREQVRIGLRLPLELFFARKLLLPRTMSEKVDEIALKDLVLKTPFRLGEICHGHSVAPAADPDKIAVWQWIVKHEFLNAALTATGLRNNQVAFVCAQAGASATIPTPFIWLRSDEDRCARWPRKVVAALATSAAALVIILGVARYQNQQAILDQLEAQIGATREKARQVRVAADKVEKQRSAIAQLHKRRSEIPGLLEIWEETTRLLPLHSYLTELRLSESADTRERRISLLGFSEAATSLIGILDRSALFSNVALTAPVATDPMEKRERFALQATIHQAKPVKEARR